MKDFLTENGKTEILLLFSSFLFSRRTSEKLQHKVTNKWVTDNLLICLINLLFKKRTWKFSNFWFTNCSFMYRNFFPSSNYYLFMKKLIPIRETENI